MLDKLTSWWRVSYCAARIRALACLGFWPWFVWAGVTINATIGEPLDVHPPFGEDEAEIVGVYETPNSSRKWIYTSDGTLEAKRESDDSYSPNFFWLPKEYRGDDYEGQRRWTVNKEGYVEYYLKKPLYYSKWIIDEDAPSMKILPNGDMLESESTYMNVLLEARGRGRELRDLIR